MNIYTPNVDLNKDELLPVVVWIYGGGFITGSGVFTEYGPEKWLDQGIVVVTVNYRYKLIFFSSFTFSQATFMAVMLISHFGRFWSLWNSINYSIDLFYKN